LSEILLERSASGIATITLNRPHRKNAVPVGMWNELRRLLQEVSQHASDRVLVITGAGDAFCTGADLADVAVPGDRAHPLHAMIPVNAAALALHEMTKPTIAKVNGDAVGAGMNLALGCDLVVAAESARFSEIFARLVGMHKAKELAFFGDILSAREAESIGLVNRVVPDAELDSFVAEWAERLASGAPLAQQLSKKLLSNAFSIGLSEALDAEATAQSVNLLTEDTKEGVVAFLEKRKPVFRGR
jgi:2-(1,2-epoxy-1,2-dihydrophenyl)acetyl-CoA isomerase